jgi:hypothetical protein
MANSVTPRSVQIVLFDGFDPMDPLERELGPKVAIEVEQLFAYERRGTTWRSFGVDATFP